MSHFHARHKALLIAGVFLAVILIIYWLFAETMLYSDSERETLEEMRQEERGITQ